MKVTSVSYQKVFPLGMYINEKIGVEVQVDEGENASVVLDVAKGIVESWHKENNKGLYLEREEEVSIIGNNKDKPTVIDWISTCKELKVLESYRLLAKSNPEYQKAYDQKFKELSA